MIWIPILLAILVIIPFLAELARRPANRSKAPGDFAALPQGRTHYRWSGPEDGPVAVCIHGLSTPSYIFAATEHSLTSMGFRVLTYDLYGRGYSANPTAPQNASFFTSQLKALLLDQGVEGDVTLVGYSMGAAIAAAAAAERPGRFNALVLIAPAGLAPVYEGWKSQFWTLPFIGDLATRLLGGFALRRELVEHRSSATVVPDLEDRQAAETYKRGFLPAVLSSRRHLLAAPRIDDHKSLAEAGIPLLAIWGTEDPVIPLNHLGVLAELNPDAQHAQIPGAGHLLLQTHPGIVADAMKKFLN